MESQGTVAAASVLEALELVGIGAKDERVRDVVSAVKRLKAGARLDPEAFCALIRPNIQVVEKTVEQKMSEKLGSKRKSENRSKGK